MFYGLIEKTCKKVIENKLLENNGYYSIDFDNLEALFKEHKIMILCSPHNPVGRVFTDDELTKIVKLAKKHNVYLLSDEVHADIILNDNQFISALNYYDLYDNILVFIAPSKTFNIAGLHISLVLSKNDELINKYRETSESGYFKNHSMLSVEALKAAYSICDDWLHAQNKHLSNNYLVVKNHFDKFHPKVILSPIEGTYLLWVNLKYLKVDQETLLKTFEEQGVLLADGLAYGKDASGYVRMNLAVSKEQLHEGLERISKAIKILDK